MKRHDMMHAAIMGSSVSGSDIVVLTDSPASSRRPRRRRWCAIWFWTSYRVEHTIEFVRAATNNAFVMAEGALKESEANLRDIGRNVRLVARIG